MQIVQVVQPQPDSVAAWPRDQPHQAFAPPQFWGCLGMLGGLASVRESKSGPIIQTVSREFSRLA